MKNKKDKTNMRNIQIFDPAMCCSTGVCGPSIDPELLRISTLINSLEQKGITIKRYNLTNDTQEYVSNKLINDLLSKEGAEILPITLLDGKVAQTKTYPTNKDFAKWLGIPITAIKAEKKESRSCCCGNGGCC